MVGTTILPDYSHNIFLSSDETGKGTLVLADKENPCQARGELAQVFQNRNASYQLRNSGIQVDGRLLEAFNRMMEKYWEETGNNQLLLLNGYCGEEDKRQIEPPPSDALGWGCGGESPANGEHGTGLAVDLAQITPEGQEPYTGGGVQEWLTLHMTEYGFLPYGGEGYPGHLRYVGIPHAQIMKERGYNLQEYLEELRVYSFAHPYRATTPDGFSWMIYYVAAQEGGTQVKVPADGRWQISGDNQGGFVVTVQEEPESFL